MELTQEQKDKIAKIQKIYSSLYPSCPDLLSVVSQIDTSTLQITAKQLQPLRLRPRQINKKR